MPLLAWESPLETSVGSLASQALSAYLKELSGWYIRSAHAGPVVNRPGYLLPGLSQVVSSDVLSLC